MALIKCPECRKEISSEAKACPNCGKPIKQSPKKPWYKIWWIWLIIGLSVYLIAMVIILFVNMNRGAQLYRDTDFHKQMEEIGKRSEQISSEAQEQLEELNGAQSQLDRYTTAHIFRGVRFSAQIIGNLLIFTTRCSIIIIEIYRWRVYGNLV